MMCKNCVCLLAVGLVIALSGSAPARVIVAEKLLVDLRADDLDYGKGTTVWKNHGTLADFTAVGNPVVQDVGGRKTVTFDGSCYFEGPLTPAGIHGNGTRSIEVWARNGSDFVAEESMVSWSHRGGPDYTNMVFNYGNSTSWGAAAHWGAGDMPWSGVHAPAPAADTWWYLVYTYDGATVRIYVNAVENTSKALTLNTHGPNIIRVAAQANDTGASAFTNVNFTGSIAEVRIHDGVLSPADIAHNFVSKPGEPTATTPDPEDEQTDVIRDVVLNWKAGPYAATHDVYLGTVFDDVNEASASDPRGVLVRQGLTDTQFDTEGLLEFGQTYYWRIDEVNGAPDYTVFHGDVWSFTTEPYAYPITGLMVTASGQESSYPAIKTIDGSGLDGDQHSSVMKDTWIVKSVPAWIQYSFDKEYVLDELWVWNANSDIESLLNYGAKDVTVEYSLDGQNWTALENVPEFTQGPGLDGYATDIVIRFGSVAAKYVKLTINETWGSTKAASLSEVRFYHVPVRAFNPEPADAAMAVSVEPEMDWRPGRGATSHTVYLGTDASAVAGGLVAGKTLTDHGYSPTLDYGTTYYWKVDETGDAGTYAGDVWSFTTLEYGVVDDFEGYTDDLGARIYESWTDGYEDLANGSIVGYIDAPFAEQIIVHSGKQSMPLAYDNTGSATVSEAKLTFDSAQDWTQHGITSLVLYFRGQITNSPASLSVKINNTEVSYEQGADATTTGLWKQWAIPLAGSGASLKSVKSLTIGIKGSGKGTVFFDDIRLYATAPEPIAPVDPGTAGLVALYAMDGNVQDGSGRNYHGMLEGDGSYETGYSGQALAFNAINTYVDLPIGPAIATMTDMTVATHVNFGGGSGSWQRIFDFGSGTSAYVFLCPRQGTSGTMRFAIRTATVGEQIVNSPGVMTEDWHHVAAVIDSATMTLSLYLDGELVVSGPTTVLPKDMGATTQNWLGRSQYTADSYFLGSLDDFRIYSRGLSEAEVRYLAGDR
ncbi:MAG TPA: discoidin domain-containing protein [Sedimentisphaerales bacterium]|jgi:hypothetical protein|nr:discoidin domain-containing protein [Sedimentisphaerales bacterium]HNU31208.1 discoidin domain-containing protein [Sedimentisphaerales bacterium]